MIIILFFHFASEPKDIWVIKKMVNATVIVSKTAERERDKPKVYKMKKLNISIITIISPGPLFLFDKPMFL